jgi:hypothetical protein
LKAVTNVTIVTDDKAEALSGISRPMAGNKSVDAKDAEKGK